jgi:hypothetical protein
METMFNKQSAHKYFYKENKDSLTENGRKIKIKQGYWL